MCKKSLTWMGNEPGSTAWKAAMLPMTPQSQLLEMAFNMVTCTVKYVVKVEKINFLVFNILFFRHFYYIFIHKHISEGLTVL